ncbi:MAG: hypothetical protein HYY17_05765 [Planctomycetes bacterium]|nr:hypothetical protein [Planctomycetota bacterium]
MGEHALQMQKFAAYLGPSSVRREYEDREFGLVVGRGVAVVIGHGDGQVVGRADAREVARELTMTRGFDRVHTVILVSCHSGAGTFASRLRGYLSRYVQIWAPRTAVIALDYMTLPSDASGNILHPDATLHWKSL